MSELEKRPFYYDPPTNDSIGAGPHILDPYDQKRVYLSDAGEYGEGVHVKVDMEVGDIACLYSYHMYYPPDTEAYKASCSMNTSKSDEYRRHCSKYALGMQFVDATLNIPPEKRPSRNPIKKGEQLYVDYGYKVKSPFPYDFQWFWDLKDKVDEERNKKELEKKKTLRKNFLIYFLISIPPIKYGDNTVRAMNMFLVLSFLFLYTTFVSANWQEWWTYDGISGPWYWGVINPSWAMCAKGRKQSPINIDPRALLYDPGLKYFNVDKRSLDGTLENTGQFLVFKVESDRMSKMPVNITGGPLAYRYQFEKMIFHWGNDMGRDLTEEDESESNEEDEEGRHADPSHGGSQVRRGYRLVPGSEHSIDGKAFPAEIQLYGFNAHIFKNLSEAVHHPHGVVGVSILVQEAERGASPAEIMPDTDNYMTYEGSTTYPGCWETVTWILMNKPIYVTRSELLAFRQLMRGDRASPKAPLGNNIRTLQGLNARNIRTNLNFDVSTDMPSMPVSCPDVLNGVRFQTSSWVKSMSP
ncbi:unnamed protein product [Lepeophtheirus salmonis]|uniref:(salmon louse) hypothetical protein n=1 Tax=Lepeophtheirus salmonis TaxID=72036 RepID=A0A7R8CFG6_LEPSM|nr:unnamed protein product [Lepeophtheirus salmonis]CAF2806393.1 unnamed protein product [Lepeophtheirus salmonis]